MGRPDAGQYTGITARILAHGGVINLGDQTYPTGELDQEIYKKIGDNYAFIMAREAWALKSRRVPCIALFGDAQTMRRDPSCLGAAKMLSEKHWHFDMIDKFLLDRLLDYQAVILPNAGPLDAATQDALRGFVRNGGALLATGNTSLNPESGDFDLAGLFGVHRSGESPYSIGYLETGPRISQESVYHRCPLLPGFTRSGCLKILKCSQDTGIR